MARRTHRRPAPRPRQPRPRQPRPPDVPATHRVAIPGVAGRTPLAHSRGVTRLAATSLARELVVPAAQRGADAGLAPVLIELAGAEHGDLHAALGVWQREQDRLVNRAWRRPGGLARPAGL